MKRALAIVFVLGLVLLMGGCAGSVSSSTTSSTETTSTTVANESTTTPPGETPTSLSETSTSLAETSTSVSETSTTLANTHVAKPTVTAVSSRSGPTAGGNLVTITGTGFTGATSVRFGTVTTTHFTVHSSTRITVTVPPQGAGTHDVNVTTPGGRSVSNSVDKYTYRAKPTVTAVSPRSGPTAGGNLVTITGTGFTGATSIRFGTVTTTHFTVRSSTKITVTVPPHAAGTHDVNVTTSGGRSVSNSVDKYTYK